MHDGLLSNHESPPSSETFVTRKVTHAVAAIKLGRQEKPYLSNLDAERDWDYVHQYVQAICLMLQQEEPEGYALAAGDTPPMRIFIEWMLQATSAALRWENGGVDKKICYAQISK